MTENLTEKRSETLSLRGELTVVAWATLALGLSALLYCFRHSFLLLYGDAVSHLYIARRLVDSRNPGLRQLGSVWLPLPHLLLLPFAAVSAWWRNGLAGTAVSLPSYVLGCVGLYRLARMWLPASTAILAVAFYALNPGLLYMATTPMTELLYLAEAIWAILLIVQYERALDARHERFSVEHAGVALEKAAARGAAVPETRTRPQTFLIRAGLLLVAAIFTRYDGWVLAAAAWLYVSLRLFSCQRFAKPIRGAWWVFTVLLIAAPLVWLAYNASIFGDALAFLRGPYSAQAIEARTAPPGGPPHPGFHSLHISALYFLKAAEMGAVPLRVANELLWLAIAGTVAALYRFRRQQIWPVLLLWLPLPFYSYCVAYASVPIFIPLWWPFSWYNTRYGMEMLPAFALFGACFIAAALALAPKLEQWIAAALFLLIVGNGVVLLRARPLVFQEAVTNSRDRIAFEGALAKALEDLPPYDLILMYSSQDAGALQQSGIPLHRIIDEGDNLEWKHALEDPALAAPVLIAIDGDPVAQAIQQHPQGLDVVQVICSTGEPCARIYHSRAYTPRLPGIPSATGGAG